MRRERQYIEFQYGLTKGRHEDKDPNLFIWALVHQQQSLEIFFDDFLKQSFENEEYKPLLYKVLILKGEFGLTEHGRLLHC